MAHKFTSDLWSLLLLFASIQWWAFPGSLYGDSSERTADTDELVKFGASLLLTIGFVISTVKWNPKNGKTAGLGGFIAAGYTAFSTFRSGDGLHHYLFYLYSAILLMAAVHIFVFPSNPLVNDTATPDVKNNHGNFSDVVAMTLLVLSLMGLFWPEHLFQDLGPLKAQFQTQTAGLLLMIKFVACLMLMLALMISGIKWDPINGKMSGVGCLIVALSTIYNTFRADSNSLVPCLFYLYAIVIFLGALHIAIFPANPRLVNEPVESERAESQTIEAGAAPLV